MYELMELAGQEYVDVYASRAKTSPSAVAVGIDEPRPTVTAA
jgi:hypothetical protein